MSIATEAPEGLDSVTLPTTISDGDVPARVKKCPDVCPCGTAEGHVLGGLPYVVTVTMSVAGLPPIEVADLHGHIGKVVAGPALVSGDGTADQPYRELENIRSLEVVGPTYGEIYRATAVSLAEAIPGLHKLADESDAGTIGDAQETGTTAEAEAAPACKGEAQGAGCPGSAGPLAGGEAADHVDSPEASSHA